MIKYITKNSFLRGISSLSNTQQNVIVLEHCVLFQYGMRSLFSSSELFAKVYYPDSSPKRSRELSWASKQPILCLLCV